MARPTKLDEPTKKALLQGIQLGLPYELACSNAGITFQTMRNWIKRGEKAKSGEYFEFLEGVKVAEGKGSLQLLSTIRQSANEGHWQAGAWILERRYPQHFSLRQRPEIEEEEEAKPEVANESPDMQKPRDHFIVELQGIRARAREMGNHALELRAMEKEMELMGVDSETGKLGDLADTFLSGMHAVVEQATEDLSE